MPPYPPFLVAILVSTIVAGPYAGAVTALASLVAGWFAFSPQVGRAFTPIAIALYVVTAGAIIWLAHAYRQIMARLRERQVQTERGLLLRVEENNVLAEILSGEPARDILANLLDMTERYCDCRNGSVLLTGPDGKLSHLVAHLPAEYAAAVDGLIPGPRVGSCGTAAFRKETVIVDDIAVDPLWSLDQHRPLRDMALSCGLLACWSFPIFSADGAVLGTFALYFSQKRKPRDEERNVVQMAVRVASLALEQERATEHRQLLVGELKHRVNNALSVVLAIAHTTLRKQVDEATYSQFVERLRATAQASDMLTSGNLRDVEVAEVIGSAVRPFSGADNRIRTSGEQAKIPAPVILGLTLCLHELCTNASKYGALSNPSGLVNISWKPFITQSQLLIRWEEQGGPQVEKPSRRGFGSQILRSAFSGYPGCQAQINFDPEGIKCEFKVPLVVSL